MRQKTLEGHFCRMFSQLARDLHKICNNWPKIFKILYHLTEMSKDVKIFQNMSRDDKGWHDISKDDKIFNIHSIFAENDHNI